MFNLKLPLKEDTQCQKTKYLFLLVVLFLSACMPNPLSIGKVVDPKDPLFDPMKFSFFDYSGVIELRSVIRHLFPVRHIKK